MPEKSRPWYREPYVIMVIAIPLSAIIAGLVTLRLAIVSWDGLVEDDYYKNGLAINEVKSRDDAALRLRLAAEVSVDATSGRLAIDLQAAPGAVLPEQLRVDLLHATRAGLDRTLLLPRVGDSRYETPMPALARGRWNVEISAADWRLTRSWLVR